MSRRSKALPEPRHRRWIWPALGVLAVLGAGSAWLLHAWDERPRIEFTDYAREVLGKEGVASFRQGLRTYFRAGCPNHHRILVCAKKDEDAEEERSPDGSLSFTTAYSEPGKINLVPQAIGRLRQKNLLDLALHEATHACKPVEPSPLPAPLLLRKGFRVLAIHGLGIKLQLPGSEQSDFVFIEEGVAEALAVSKDERYTASVPEYHKLGTLTIVLKNTRGISASELQGFVERNDLLGFMSRVIGRPAAMDAYHLERFMDAYQGIISGDDLRQTAVALMELGSVQGRGPGPSGIPGIHAPEAAGP